MVRTTIYLADKFHSNLKHLAVTHHRSMADMIREAVEQVYKKELEEIHAAHEAIAEYRANPSKGVSAREYFSQRRKSIRRSAHSKS